MASSSDRDKASEDSKDSKDSQHSPSPPNNPFIKFRQFADAQIGSLLQGVIGLPSAFSKNPSGNTRWADFDDDLRRRDELQAKQKDLRDSEARRLGRAPVDEEEREVPVKKSATWEKPSASSQATSTTARAMDDKMVRDLPLYSPATKALFAHLQTSDGEVEWNQFHRMNPLGEGLRLEYFPFKLRQDQKPLNQLEAIQFMAYNELDGSATFRSEYSLLPYLLFSPYSPIRLSMGESPRPITSSGLEMPQDEFPYHTAFEDLIRTTQGSIGSPFPRSIRAYPPFSSLSRGIPAHNSIAWMAWLHDMYGENLLQQREVRTLPRLADMIPLSPFSIEKVGAENENLSRQAKTEQDMYDRFLRWASAPSALAGALESICNDTEGFIEKQLKALDSLDDKKAFRELMDSKFAKDVLEMAQMLDRFDRRDILSESRAVENFTKDKAIKPSQDPDKLVSTSTTTEHTAHEDGSVETCVTVWKRFADGRESVKTTTHCEDPAWDENGNAQPRQEQVKGEVELEGKTDVTKGWFWN